MHFGRPGQHSPVAQRVAVAPKPEGLVGETLTAVKEFFYPPTFAERKERHQLFKNCAIFGGAVLAMIVFEDKLKDMMDYADKEL